MILSGPGCRLLMTLDAVGGVWTHAVDLAEGLAARGWACTLAVLGPEPSPVQAARVAVIPGVALRCTGLPLDWLAQGPAVVLAAGRAIAALGEEMGAALAHLNTPALAAAGFPIPVVAACHSCVRTWWETVRGGALPTDLAWQAELVARGYAAAQALVAPSATFAAMTRASYGMARLPVTVHNGRRPARLPSAGPADIVFTAGRLWDEGKNVAALDRIAAHLPWNVVAAGPTEGPNGARVALRHIQALGRLDEAGVAAALVARPIFVSLARYEPFGLTVLEAAQAGCALVLADNPGFRELWDGAALFVPSGDDDAAVAAILQLIRDRACRERLGRRASQHAAQYTVDAMAAGMDRIYRAVVTNEIAT